MSNGTGKSKTKLKFTNSENYVQPDLLDGISNQRVTPESHFDIKNTSYTIRGTQHVWGFSQGKLTKDQDSFSFIPFAAYAAMKLGEDKELNHSENPLLAERIPYVNIPNNELQQHYESNFTPFAKTLENNSNPLVFGHLMNDFSDILKNYFPSTEYKNNITRVIEQEKTKQPSEDLSTEEKLSNNPENILEEEPDNTPTYDEVQLEDEFYNKLSENLTTDELIRFSLLKDAMIKKELENDPENKLSDVEIDLKTDLQAMTALAQENPQNKDRYFQALKEARNSELKNDPLLAEQYNQSFEKFQEQLDTKNINELQLKDAEALSATATSAAELDRKMLYDESLAQKAALDKQILDNVAKKQEEHYVNTYKSQSYNGDKFNQKLSDVDVKEVTLLNIKDGLGNIRTEARLDKNGAPLPLPQEHLNNPFYVQPTPPNPYDQEKK